MVNPKLRILMVHWDGAGNQPPQRALARELIRRGHEVHVLSHDSVGERARSDGATFHHLPTARQYQDTDRIGDSREELAFLFRHCWAAQAYADDFLVVAAELEPHLILIDVALCSVAAAAAALGMPAVRVDHSIYMPGGIGSLTSEFADEETSGMLQRASAFFDAVPLVLVPSYAAFNPEQSFGPAVRHVGPIREPANPRPWPRRFPERPFVLASLSTSFQDQAATLQRICDALSLLEVEALVTTGPAMPPEAFHAADHVELRRYTPHDEVLALTDLAITHCGHGTVMACAGAGAPMLCMPMGRDQHFVASRVEALGLGKVVDHTATATEIAEAVSAMLSNSGWKHAAVGFAAGVQRFGALELAATLVQQVAVHQRVEASLAQPI